MNDNLTEKLLITPKEACKLLGVGRTTMYSWIKNSVVPVVKFPNCRNIYISVEALHEMIKAHTITSPVIGGDKDE